MRLYKETITGRKIYLGQIDNNIYSRNITNEHFYEFTKEDGGVYKGLFIDKDAFEQHVLPKCSQIIIRNTQSNMLYFCSAKIFLNSATLLKDRYALEEEAWQIKKDEPALHGSNIICEE